jgi:hypothetical protein
MNDFHTYPISEAEAHKLDELEISPRADLQGQARMADQWIRDNAPLAAGIALLVGFLFGRALKR